VANIKEQAIGKITSGLVPDTLALKTIDFVHAQLPAWRDDLSRPDEESEKRLNLQLCKFLDSHARNDFPMVQFIHEEYQPNRRSTDISASPVEQTTIGAKLYTIYDTITVFECKRLPTPSNKRQKEYVTGGVEDKSGGIQRFKLGLHGVDHDIVAMIGYLQKCSVSYWHKEINKWIAELCSGIIPDTCDWNLNEILDLLEEDTSNGTAKCRSVHSRTSDNQSNRITIYHLWIKMYK